MSIHFYRDDCGAVGDRDPLDGPAGDILDLFGPLELRAGEMQRGAERIEDLIGICRDSIERAPDGYTRHHAAEWAAIAAEAERIAAALRALRLRVELA